MKIIALGLVAREQHRLLADILAPPSIVKGYLCKRQCQRLCRGLASRVAARTETLDCGIYESIAEINLLLA